MEKLCLGVDVGGTSVKIGLFETSGTLLDKWEVITRLENAGAEILPDVAKSIHQKLAQRQLRVSDLAGCGIGVPGPVMPDGYVEVCVNLGWRERYPSKELSQLLDGIPVKSNNDANVAALGEMWQGGGKGYANLVMITLGTGVGGGVILDHQILSGKHGLGGEIGHIHVRPEEKEFCNCGGMGCLEQVASATGIVREAKRMLQNSELNSVIRQLGDGITAKDVLDAAKGGDLLANQVIDTMSYYLGQVMGQVSMIIDPELFVIGGGVSKAGSFLMDKIEAYYHKFTPITKHKAQIGLATLGNDAGIYGAARLLLY